MANIMERFEANRGKSPDEAGMYWSGGPVEVASRTWFVSNFSGSPRSKRRRGLVLVASGTERLAPGLAAQLRENTRAPVYTAIFTHGHLDHAYGLKSFLVPDQPRPRIVAQRAILDQFARYERTTGLNAGINARQFGRARGDVLNAFRLPAPLPDLLFDERVGSQPGNSRSRCFTAAAKRTMHAGFSARSDGWCAPVISSSTRCPMPAIRRRCSATLGTGQTGCAR